MRKCAKNKAPIQFCIRNTRTVGNAGFYPTSDNPFRDRNRAPRYFPFPPTPKIPLTVETGTTRFTFLPPKPLLRPKTKTRHLFRKYPPLHEAVMFASAAPSCGRVRASTSAPESPGSVLLKSAIIQKGIQRILYVV